ncbi:MAG: M48 family peptidase, partial [Nocardioides sp.]|nr:M48 family peptidase [Nocardioides sp.]
MSTPDRRAALWTTGVGATVFVVVAVWLVPWDPVPGGDLQPLDARAVFTDAQIERAASFALQARIWSWSSLAVSLAMVCWLAFSRRGRAHFERLPGPWWAQVPVAVAAVELLRRLVT